MQLRTQSGTFAAVAALGLLFISAAVGQNVPVTPTSGARASKGIPPRANAGEYLSHAQAGSVTIAAEFDGHSVPTPDSTLSTEDFVAVEIGLFGAPGAHTTVSFTDFSLRINGKKNVLPAEQFAAVFRNLRDPTWVPPDAEATKEASKTGISGGGNNNTDAGATPPVIHIPPEMERAMQEQVQNAALPEGERTLPIAGLIFFRYSGTQKGIHSVELIYAGAAGKAVVPLQP